MFGLSHKTIDSILSVFAKYANIEMALLYGSRAKGNFRYNSDIDITLKGQGLNFTQLLKIENEIDDLLLPYKVDLSLYDNIENQELLDHINRIGKPLYKKEGVLV